MESQGISGRTFWQLSREGKLETNAMYAHIIVEFSGNHRYYHIFYPEPYKEKVLRDGNTYLETIHTNNKGHAIKRIKK